jgi:hypothetical protein
VHTTKIQLMYKRFHTKTNAHMHISRMHAVALLHAHKQHACSRIVAAALYKWIHIFGGALLRKGLYCCSHYCVCLRKYCGSTQMSFTLHIAKVLLCKTSIIVAIMGQVSHRWALLYILRRYYCVKTSIIVAIMGQVSHRWALHIAEVLLCKHTDELYITYCEGTIV